MLNATTIRIVVRRGLATNLQDAINAEMFAEGELIYVTDEHILYVADSEGVAHPATKTKSVMFGDLPGGGGMSPPQITPEIGMLYTVIDSNTAVWGATIAGGGANIVLAYYNGSNWTVAGK